MGAFAKTIKRRIKTIVAISLTLLMGLSTPIQALAQSADADIWLSTASGRQSTRLDLSRGRITGLNNTYEFRIPALWKDNVIAERTIIGNPSYVLDRVDFSCQSVTRQAAPQLLMSLYVIDKTRWTDSLPYTPLLISRDYVFCVTKSNRASAFTSDLDKAMYRACSDEISTPEAIRSRIFLSQEQELWRELTVVVNGKELDMPVVIIDGTYYLPMRAVCEALGYTVTWSQATRTTTIKKGTFIDRIPAEPNMVRDSRGYKMRMINNRTYVSVSYIYNVFRTIIEIDDAKNVYVISDY